MDENRVEGTGEESRPQSARGRWPLFAQQLRTPTTILHPNADPFSGACSVLNSR